VPDGTGAGTNRWYHSDQIYRTFFTVIVLCGCEGGKRRAAGHTTWAREGWYENFRAAELASPLGHGLFAGRTFADRPARASRLGWTPRYPAFGRNPLDLCYEAERAWVPAAES
jgi:nitrate reductase alpha subunit